MKLLKTIVLLFILASISLGCGSSSSSNEQINLTGTWIGSFVITEVADPSNTETASMLAEFVQTGDQIVGTFSIVQIVVITSGTFESFTRSGNSLGGIMDDGGHAWTNPAVFSGNVSGRTIIISGTILWPGIFATDTVFFQATISLN
ncbi:hypothetical protein ACFL1T_03950 [Chlamydiota bacterium]